MAELGTIGLLVGPRLASAYQFDADAFRCFLPIVQNRSGVMYLWNLGGGLLFGCAELYRYGVMTDPDTGNAAPSLKVRGHEYPFRLAVKAGARTVSVDVLQPVATAQRPRLMVKANPDIGLTSDQTATAGAGTGWQTLSVAFTATANGGVRVLLVNEDAANPAWFDNVRIV